MASYLGDFIESPGKRYFNFLLCHFQGWLLLLTQYGYQSCSHHICIPGSRTEEVQRKAISSWILLSSCIQCPYFYIIGPKLVTWPCISLNGGQYAQLKVRIVITKEIGENGFTEINNTYFHVVILFVCGGVHCWMVLKRSSIWKWLWLGFSFLHTYWRLSPPSSQPFFLTPVYSSIQS